MRLSLPADGVDRPVLAVERLIEGDRRERMKKDAGMDLERVSETVLKHSIWLMIAGGPAAPGCCISPTRRRW